MTGRGGRQGRGPGRGTPGSLPKKRRRSKKDKSPSPSAHNDGDDNPSQAVKGSAHREHDSDATRTTANGGRHNANTTSTPSRATVVATKSENPPDTTSSAKVPQDAHLDEDLDDLHATVSRFGTQGSPSFTDSGHVGTLADTGRKSLLNAGRKVSDAIEAEAAEYQLGNSPSSTVSEDVSHDPSEGTARLTEELKQAEEEHLWLVISDANGFPDVHQTNHDKCDWSADVHVLAPQGCAGGQHEGSSYSQ